MSLGELRNNQQYYFLCSVVQAEKGCGPRRIHYDIISPHVNLQMQNEKMFFILETSLPWHMFLVFS